MRWGKIGMLAAAVAMASASAHADGLTTLATYQHGGTAMEVDTYTDSDQTVGLIGLRSSDASISFAFDSNDTSGLLGLWSSALAETSDKWVSAGVVDEVGSSAHCVLSLAGSEQGVRVSILDPVKGAVTFDLTADEASEFDAKLRQAASVTTSTR